MKSCIKRSCFSLQQNLHTSKAQVFYYFVIFQNYYNDQLLSLNVTHNISNAIWNNKEIPFSLLYTKQLLTIHTISDKNT